MTMWNERCGALAVSGLMLATLAGCADAGDASVAGAEPTNEIITNNQEEGVDEGGIVKNIGDHLVVLRQGRLFAVDMAGERIRQTDSARVAMDEELNQQVWYDEMLVHGSDIYVIGYRYVTDLDGSAEESSPYGYYGVGATEIAHFNLEEDGTIARMETQFFESMDYYDYSNYSSRLIGDRLIFYMPLTGQARMLDYLGDGKFRGGEVLQGVEDTEGVGSVAHTIVTCPMNYEDSTQCTADVLRGEWASARYVTRDDVFLWLGDRVYAMSLEDGQISQHAVHGHPLDQFSFQMKDDELRVVVNTADYYNYRDSESSIELLRLKREDFDQEGSARVEREVIYKNSRESVWVHKNRFTQDAVIVAYNDPSDWNTQLVTVRDLETGAQKTMKLDGESVTRIEPMRGVGALIASTHYERRKRRLFRQDPYMNLRSVDTRGALEVMDHIVLEGSKEGEWRSHGFFFKPNKTGGTFGMPVIGGGLFSGWWGSGVSNIAFFDVTGEGDLSHLGSVSSSKRAEGECETSCVDWYGNTRPIFLKGRIFALMGSEVVETEIRGASLKELQRILLQF